VTATRSSRGRSTPCSPAGVGRARNGRLLRIELAGAEDEACWSEFLRGWHGVPLVVVSDGDRALRNAVRSVWPGGRVALVRCVYHWRRNLFERVTGDLVRALGLPATSATVGGDELLRSAHRAFSGPGDFLAFVRAAHDRLDAAPTAALCLDWLGDNGPEVLARPGPGPSPAGGTDPRRCAGSGDRRGHLTATDGTAACRRRVRAQAPHTAAPRQSC
jgi:hypothetical protein